MTWNWKDALCVYTFLTMLQICVTQYHMTDSPTVMTVNLEDDDSYFNGSFSCRSQLDCARECFKQTHHTPFYYSLFKRDEKLCVCSSHFHWSEIEVSGTDEIVRIQLRQGSVK